MSIKVILFDLDGTLLPMSLDKFIGAYFGALVKRLVPLGYEEKGLLSALWEGTRKMVENDGAATNERVFWRKFIDCYGAKAAVDKAHFDRFYTEEFDSVRESCGFNADAAQAVRAIKALGYRVALATNPVFPAIATEKRLLWTGLSPEEFEYYTTYENSCYTKPNLKYYEQITEKLGVCAEECLMVGNDVSEDMVAERLGMKVFLLTDCLINKENADISVYPNGNFSDLLHYINSL